MSIFINSTWGKWLAGKVLSKVLRKKGFNATVKVNELKTINEDNADCVTLKVDLEIKARKDEIDKLVDNFM